MLGISLIANFVATLIGFIGCLSRETPAADSHGCPAMP